MRHIQIVNQALLLVLVVILAGCKGEKDNGRHVKHFVNTYVTIKDIEATVAPRGDSLYISIVGVLDKVFREGDRDSSGFLRYSQYKGDTAYRWLLCEYSTPQGRTLGPDMQRVRVVAASSYSDQIPKDADLLEMASITYTSYDDHIYRGYINPLYQPTTPLDEYSQAVKKSHPLVDFHGVRLPRLKDNGDLLFEIGLFPPPAVRPARVRIELLLDSGKMHEVEVEIE